MEAGSLEQAVERDIAVVVAVHTYVPDEVSREFPGQSVCILTARVTLELLKHYKVPARAIPMKVAIFNERMVERISKEGRMPKDTSEGEQWAKQDGSWGLAIGYTGAVMDGHYDGHLGVLVHYKVNSEDEDIGGILLDLAIGQASRPSRGIVLEPLSSSVPAQFLSGEAFLASCNGCVLNYTYFPESHEWTRTPDWRDPDRRAPIIERAKKKIDVALASQGLLDG